MLKKLVDFSLACAVGFSFSALLSMWVAIAQGLPALAGLTFPPLLVGTVLFTCTFLFPVRELIEELR